MLKVKLNGITNIRTYSELSPENLLYANNLQAGYSLPQAALLVVLAGLAVAAPSNTYSSPAPTYSAPHQPSYDQVTQS